MRMIPHGSGLRVRIVGPDKFEGTLDAALATGYERREDVVHGPLGALLRASCAMRGDQAVVELAAALALALVPAGRRDALAASSRGTGELIAAALDAGRLASCSRSATALLDGRRRRPDRRPQRERLLNA